MFNHILVPLDGSSDSECVLPHVIAFAQAFYAQISLLYILEQPSPGATVHSVDPLEWQLKKSEAEAYLTSVSARFEASALQAGKIIVEGRAAEQISAFVQNNGVDVVILGTHGQQGVSSLGHQILQRLSTSILIVRADLPAPAEGLHYRRVLVPLDGSRRAESALPTATMLAQAHEADFLIVHVVSKPEMPRRMPLSQEDSELLNRVVERNVEEGKQYLEQVQAHLPANVQTQLLVSDNVVVALQDFIDEKQIDLVIASAHGYSGEARWPYGAVTSRMITDGTAPLLIVQDLPTAQPEAPRDEVATRQPGQ